MTVSQTRIYDVGVSRTDRRGRELKTFLEAEIVGRAMTVEELRTACGLTSSRYYGEPSGTGRAAADDFPNTEELRHIAEHFGLDNEGYLNLLVEFGWLDPRPDAQGFTRPPVAVATKKNPPKARQRKKLSERKPVKRKPGL